MGYVYLKPEEVTARWKGAITVRTLANWRHAHKGPPVIHIGGKPLYRLDQLEAWESKQKEGVKHASQRAKSERSNQRSARRGRKR